MRMFWKSGRSLKMLQNEPLIAAIGVNTAEKCTIENLQNLQNSQKSLTFAKNNTRSVPVHAPPRGELALKNRNPFSLVPDLRGEEGRKSQAPGRQNLQILQILQIFNRAFLGCIDAKFSDSGVIF